MGKPNDDIQARLLAIFRTEAEEHLQAITTNLLALDRDLPPERGRELVEATFREVHTLKGAARSVGHLDVEALCQAMESVLSRITHGGLTLSRPIWTLLQHGMDGVARLLAAEAPAADMRDLLGRLEQVATASGIEGSRLGVEDAGQAAEPPSAVRRPPSAVQPAGTIRVATAKLDALLLQAEDLLIPKLACGERVREARVLVEAVNRASLSSAVPNLQASAPALRAAEARGRELLDHLRRDYRTLEGAVNALQEEVRRLRLSPASIILDVFPRMVRDLAEEHGKRVEWALTGADLEVDRKVLEAVKEPLIHLVRNAIDHGIESPKMRRQADKPPQGRVEVTVTPLEGERLEIRVEDDGQGMDPGKLRSAAIRTRFLTPEAAERLSDEAALELAFRSGLSTSAMITDVSGHGLGLAIVKERAEHLGGQVQVTTLPGKGTTIRMLLPASIATFRGLLVQVGQQAFLLPLDAVAQSIRIAPEEIRNVEGRQTIRWSGGPLSIVPLRDLLGLLPASPVSSRAEGAGGTEGKARLCVIAESGEERVGLLVDEVLGDREVLVKEFRPPLVRVRNFSGAGLLGTGQVVLILRPPDLFRLAQTHRRPQEPAAPARDESRPRTILVVDDSITTRVMEKNLLEAAGYPVRVAVDGIEAWTLLKSEEFSLVVSDVDMPRMDGFALTARIRADRALADLPVILVTALESREDKERGIEVGANAYVVKSSFDQSNLLEIIHRLM